MATTYVDNSVADDSGDGSIGDPWKYIAAHVDDLSPLDLMYVRGDAYPGRIYTEAMIAPTVSGTSGNPITVQPYPGEFVIVQTTGAHVLKLAGEDYWEFRNFAFDRQSTWDASPLTRNVWITDANNIVLRNCKMYNATTGLHHSSGDYNLYDNCEIYDNSTGMYLNGGTGDIVRACTFANNRGDAIQCYDSPIELIDAIIEDSHLYTTNGLCAENAIDVKQGNVIIRRNVMHGFRFSDGSCGGTGANGEAVNIHMYSHDCVVEDNIIYDCSRGMTLLNDHVCVIQRNLFYDLFDQAGKICIALHFHAVWLVDGVKVYDNTFAGCPDHLFWLSPTSQNIKFRNNLCYNTKDITVESGGTYDADYNGWFDCEDTLVGTHDTTGEGDPGFRDAANDDYHLRRGSPVVNAGVDVGDPFIGSAPDLGAYEHRRFIIASSWP